MLDKICPKCGICHTKNGTFCSRSCASSRGPRSDETKAKLRISNKVAYEKLDKEKFSKSVKENHRYAGPYTPIKLIQCTNCNKSFWTTGRTWCEDLCFLKIKRKNWQGNKQRFMENSYDSSWEVDLHKWFIENNIEFEIPKISIEWIDCSGKKRKYFPDFYVPKLKLYVDPKNPIVINQQKEKLDYLKDRINLIYGNLKEIKEYITRVYPLATNESKG